MRIASALAMAKMLVAERLKTASCVVDATAGNGFDTLFLAREYSSGSGCLEFRCSTNRIG